MYMRRRAKSFLYHIRPGRWSPRGHKGNRGAFTSTLGPAGLRRERPVQRCATPCLLCCDIRYTAEDHGHLHSGWPWALAPPASAVARSLLAVQPSPRSYV